MRTTVKSLLASLILVVEVGIAAAIALGGLVVNAFWVNEGLVNTDTYPWWSTAGRAFAAWLIPIALFGGLAWVLNRWVVGAGLGWSQRMTRKVTVAVSVLSASGSILGALFFGFVKPHM